MSKPAFYEFFAGGGMARAGLGEGWECLFANDFDPKKRDAYIANWGADRFHFGDIHDLGATDLPGRADLAWASFPCQDLSLAGNGAGLNGERSGAFWGLMDLVEGLAREGRAPKILVLENVVGALTSAGGRDFEALCRSLHLAGYLFGALTMDAVHFVPQSRPRLFVVAVRRSLTIPPGLIVEAPAQPWASPALRRAWSALQPDLQKAWRWWALPAPPQRNVALADVVEDDPADVAWHAPEETRRLVAMMSAANLEKLKEAARANRRVVGTIYRRTRFNAEGEKVQRAEVRFDGIAGCLRTPGGGSSRQFVMFVEGADVRTRLLSGREAARLMGLADDYILPGNYNDAYHLLGDGLAAPVIGYIEKFILASLIGRASRAPAPLAAE